MKKILFSLLAIFASTAAFAEDQPAANPFKYSGMAYAYGARYNTVTKDQTSSYGAYRFRPYFSYLTENVDATVKLEIDQVMGGSKDNSLPTYNTTTGSANKGTGNQQADVGNDEKTVEVKAAYLKFKVPTLSGLSLKGGVDEFKTVGGFVCGTELGLGLVNYKTDIFDLTLAAAKVWEPNDLDTKGDNTTEKNDVTLYAADTTFTLSDSIKIRPALYAIQSEKNQNPSDSGIKFVGKTAFIPSIGANLKFGSLGIDLAGSYGTCAKDDNKVKYSGYAVDIAPLYKADDNFSVGGFFTMLSGDDGKSATKNKSFSSFLLKQDGWGRLYLLENMQTYNNAGTNAFADIRKNPNGYMVFGANAAYKINAFEIKAQAAYGRLAKVASGLKKDLGTEIDASVSYEVEKNAKVLAEFAYLATGKAFGDKGPINSATKNQKAMYTALGMICKW